MSLRSRLTVITGLLAFSLSALADPLGTGFSYQGHLRQNGEPFTGPVALSFTLWDAATDGSQVGEASVANAEVSNGLFTAVVNESGEFGPGAFAGDERFLEITINGETLPVRQRISPTPHALFSPGGGGGDSVWSLSGEDAYYDEGDVGVGTNSPQARMHVHEGSIWITGTGEGGLPAAAGDGLRLFRDPDGDGKVFAWDYVTNTARSLSLQNPGGNLGVGTDQPETKLHVDGGSIWVTGNAEGGLEPSAGAGIRMGNGANNPVPFVYGWEWGTDTPLDLALQPQGGNVGIGTNEPDERLSVDGRIESFGESGGFVFPDGSVQTTAAIGGGGGDSVWSLNGADAYYNAGNVGIGTNTPSAPLEVAGSVRATSFTSPNPNNSEATANFNWLDDVARIRVGGSGAGAQNGFSIQSTGDEVLLRVTDNPTEVGIATNNPMAKLHVRAQTIGLQTSALENDDIIVEGQDSALGLYSTSQGAWGSAIALKEVTTGATPGEIVDTWGIARQTSPSGSKLHFTYGPSDNYSSNPATMVMDAEGNVGIGTTSPERELDVNGSILVDGAGTVPLILTDDSVYGAGLVMGNCFNCPSAAIGYDGTQLQLAAVNGIFTNNPDYGLIINNQGRVGIGTSVIGSEILTVDGDATVQGDLSLRDDANAETIVLDATEAGDGPRMLMYNSAGNLTIELDADEGDGAAIHMDSAAGVGTVFIDADEGGSAVLQLRNAANQVVVELDADQSGSGRVITEVLEITGGSDLSEQFDISSAAGTVEPGMIVTIDPANPGQLTVSKDAYDKKVAGVVSGAGGVQTGMLMGQRDTIADGAHPVALTGRVWCYVDASYGAVEPGDLLTTSSTPGHGMKVSAYDRAHGAVIGKAMTSLAEGRGLVLVLVQPQ